MTDTLTLLLAAVVGAALGALYFGGLWLTVRRLPTSRHPALLMLASLLGRTVVLFAGFYFVSGGRWERLAVAFVAFIVVRIIMRRRLGPEAVQPHSDPEGNAAT